MYATNARRRIILVRPNHPVSLRQDETLLNIAHLAQAARWLMVPFIPALKISVPALFLRMIDDTT